MSNNFNVAHKFTEKWEGGLVDHSADPGGITNLGISLRWLRKIAKDECTELSQNYTENSANAINKKAISIFDFDADGDIDADDIKVCSKSQARTLFKKYFWQVAKCHKLPLAISIVLYDGSVNMGVPRAVRQLQQSLNIVSYSNLEPYEAIAEDGICGPKTIELAEALAETNLDFYTARQCIGVREKFYRDLAQRRPNLKVFLKGWQNRCKDLLNYLATIEREI